MSTNKIVSRGEWLEARKALLRKEKDFDRQRDALSRERRELPWVKVTESYKFQGPRGEQSLFDLFGERSQLIVYHFMLPPEWDEGCKSCSYLADHFDGCTVHLNARDVKLVVVSRAPLAKIEAFKKRMGWKFEWVSSFGSDFNRDYGVTMVGDNPQYNYAKPKWPGVEHPGMSAFVKEGGVVYHTYSTYARGLDWLIGTYHFLDRAPRGRNEEGLSHGMEWVRHHDRY
jgi:predicted dithiol-disulfide oxidoreductase (DUF899 family)